MLKNLRGRLVAEIAHEDTGPNVVADLYSYTDEGLVSMRLEMVPGMEPQVFSYEQDSRKHPVIPSF